MSEFQIKVEGVKESVEKLYSFGNNIGNKVIRKALRNGAMVMLRTARADAPKRTGALRKRIILSNSKYNNGRRRKVIGVFIKIKRPNTLKRGKADYGIAQEFGWKDRGRHAHAGKRFVGRAYDSKAVQAVQLATASIKVGADVLSRNMGLKK